MTIEDEIDKIINGSNIKIVDEHDDNLGKDLQEISKELTNDKNVFRFSNSNKILVGYDSLLGAIGDRPNYRKDIKPRYAFIQSYRYHYHICRASVKSEQANRFKDLAGSLINFRAMLEYRQAGVSQPLEDEKKHSLLDKMKKG